MQPHVEQGKPSQRIRAAVWTFSRGSSTHRRGLAVALLLAVALAGAGSWAAAQPPLAAGVRIALPQQLLTAMRARMTVSIEKRSGKTISASHCRHVSGGCDQRLGAFAEYLSSSAS